MPATKMRDVTRALELAKIIRDHAGDDYSPEINNELVKILTELDARTGRRDPRVRKRAAKKGGKKAGARTR